MQEEIVSFQVAKLAKEKGFDWEVHSSFYKMTFEDTWRNNTNENSKLKNWNIGEYISRPQQSLLQKWLREVHGIIVEITWQMCSTDYEYAIIDMNNPPKYEDDIERIIGFKTYEETLEEGLYEGLKLIEDIEKV